MESNFFNKASLQIRKYEKFIIDIQSKLTAIPAVGPENGGNGEKNKSDYLKTILNLLNPDEIKNFKAPDDRVSNKYRPNLMAKFHGKKGNPTVWIITHLDVVPPGDLSLWKTDPFKMVYKNGKLIGRGVEDNQQAMVSSIITAKAIRDLNLIPKNSLGLLFVSDEETGSKNGLKYVLKNHKNIFSKNDLFIVPDYGNSYGTMIEVAEKAMLWLKFEVIGKQAHGSRPDLAINSYTASSYLVTKLNSLHTRFNKCNPLFDFPYSSFEPTKKEQNVSNINTIPGKDIFYMDCRILPNISVERILSKITKIVKEIEREFKVKIIVNPTNINKVAPQTSAQSTVVKTLSKAIKEVNGKSTKIMGIGGGTLATFLRREGFETAVWATIQETAHQPNEFCFLNNLINDAKIFLRLIL